VKPRHLLLVLVLSTAVAAACSASVAPSGAGTGNGGAGGGSSHTGTGATGGQGVSVTSSSSSTGSGAAGGGDAGAGPDASGAGGGACTSGTTRPCTTSCGSNGTETCGAGTWGACAPPQETCNLADDDCSGYCDDILGCRIGVDRAYDATNGAHFYTTTDSEASCCGYAVESYGYYYLYSSAQAGLVPFYRCRTSAGTHLYTTDASCDGATSEGSMGWIATGAVCGSVPLYHLYDATSDDHLYTTSAAEAASAEAGGYASQGTAGYVWTAGCGGPSCVWPSPIDMVGSTTTGATGFPTAWYGFPIEPGAESMSGLSGTVTLTNSANLYAEVLFILQYLPSGACPAGLWPATTPEYGPPGAHSLAQFIVKAPAQGTFTLPIDLTLPGGGVPISGCVLLGLNGGSVSTPQRSRTGLLRAGSSSRGRKR
jgi:hypothetical protein